MKAYNQQIGGILNWKPSKELKWVSGNIEYWAEKKILSNIFMFFKNFSCRFIVKCLLGNVIAYHQPRIILILREYLISFDTTNSNIWNSSFKELWCWNYLLQIFIFLEIFSKTEMKINFTSAPNCDVFYKKEILFFFWHLI